MPILPGPVLLTAYCRGSTSCTASSCLSSRMSPVLLAFFGGVCAGSCVHGAAAAGSHCICCPALYGAAGGTTLPTAACGEPKGNYLQVYGLAVHFCALYCTVLYFTVLPRLCLTHSVSCVAAYYFLTVHVVCVCCSAAAVQL